MITATQHTIDPHIVRFMKEQTVITIATACNNIPHCAMCFYVYVEELNSIVFKSKPSSLHVNQALVNSDVAGSILPDKLMAGKTSGIQLNGVFTAVAAEQQRIAAKQYYNKYPFAAVVPGELWMIALTHIVFTDATLGFGKKRNWQQQPGMV